MFDVDFGLGRAFHGIVRFAVLLTHQLGCFPRENLYLLNHLPPHL